MTAMLKVTDRNITVDNVLDYLNERYPERKNIEISEIISAQRSLPMILTGSSQQANLHFQVSPAVALYGYGLKLFWDSGTQGHALAFMTVMPHPVSCMILHLIS